MKRQVSEQRPVERSGGRNRALNGEFEPERPPCYKSGAGVFMEEQAETREETKYSRGFGSYALWAGVVLVLYVLSFGPVAMIGRKLEPTGLFRSHPRFFELIHRPYYAPLGWAYYKTPLHKPLGMYMHLWCPQSFDKHGEPPAKD